MKTFALLLCLVACSNEQSSGSLASGSKKTTPAAKQSVTKTEAVEAPTDAKAKGDSPPPAPADAPVIAPAGATAEGAVKDAAAAGRIKGDPRGLEDAAGAAAAGRSDEGAAGAATGRIKGDPRGFDDGDATAAQAAAPAGASGKPVGNYYWHLGGGDQSCDEACSAFGGPTDGTIAFTEPGPDGCHQLAQAFGINDYEGHVVAKTATSVAHCNIGCYAVGGNGNYKAWWYNGTNSQPTTQTCKGPHTRFAVYGTADDGGTQAATIFRFCSCAL